MSTDSLTTTSSLEKIDTSFNFNHLTWPTCPTNVRTNRSVILSSWKCCALALETIFSLNHHALPVCACIVSHHVRRLSFPSKFHMMPRLPATQPQGTHAFFFSFVCMNGQCGFCLLFVCVFISRNWLTMIIDCRFDHGLAMVKAVDGNCGCCWRTNAEEH